MINTSECNAKDPATCRFHGSALKMVEAQKSGDFEAYYLARKNFEAAEKANRRRLFGKEKPILEVPEFVSTAKEVALPIVENDTKIRDHQEEAERLIKKEAERSAQIKRNRIAYLTNSEAVVTPMEAFALWVSVAEAQGATVSVSDYDYMNASVVDANNNAFKGAGETLNSKPDYESLAWNRWTPTRPGFIIPEGYGSMALQLLVLPDVVDQPLVAQAPRKGWEWGHTKVYVLEKDDSPIGFKASTNDRTIKSYRDVENYRRGKTLPQLASELAARSDAFSDRKAVE